MTMKQIQHLLAYLGYYTLELDGLTGPGTHEATRIFQRDNGLVADGIPGAKTQAALVNAVANGRFKPAATPGTCDDASQYLGADGYYHIPRGVNVQLSKNLWSSEVACQGKGCCTESIISRRMVETFQQIRDAYGGPIAIVDQGGSGFRCTFHNACVGGSRTSLHLTGDAFDLHAADKNRLLAVCEKVITDGEIGIYSWGVHAGVWNKGFVNRFYGD